MLIHTRPAEAAPTAAAHDRVYRTLRTRIMHGELAPGASADDGSPGLQRRLRALRDMAGFLASPASVWWTSVTNAAE